MRTLLLPLMLLTACTPEAPSFRNLEPEIAVTPPAIGSWTQNPDDIQRPSGSALGDIPVGSFGTAELFVTNAGKAGLDIGVVLEGTAFTIDTTAGTVEPDTSAIVLVTFTPDNFRDYTGSITVDSNDELQPSITVPLTGKGIDAPEPNIDVSSRTIDFGLVPFGDSVTLFDEAEITNDGNAPLRIGEMTIEGEGFVIDALWQPGAVMDVGGSFPVILTYEPTAAETGNTGYLVIPSDDPDEPEVRVTLLGNGGEGFEYPEAIIACPTTVEIVGPQPIRLDGAESNDPAGHYPLDYTWQTIRVPLGSATSVLLPRTELSAIEVPLDVAGEYEVLLTVHNGVDTPSPATSCVMNVIPADDIRVELSWDSGAADIDLHVLENEDAEYYYLPGDACWCNKSPDWGENGSDDDPRLDIDARSNFGPENVNIGAPVDGNYPVKVHYFAPQGESDLVVATVVVWADGVKVWEGSQPMNKTEVWDVGQVVWPDATFVESNEPLTTPNLTSCQD